jgi:hypothetical protein
MPPYRWTPLLCLASLLALPQPAILAAQIASVIVPDQVTVADTVLPLRGVGLMKWHHLVKVHTAAFWLPAGAGALDEVPKRLDLHYLRSFTAADFRSVTEDSMTQTSGAATVAQLRPLLDSYEALYIDRPENTGYSLTYRPGIGTELAADGTVLGVIPGAAFAHALFAIWLGPTPIDAGLQSQLLRP